MRQFTHALFFGILLASCSTLLFFSHPGSDLEENLGLKILFGLRGPKPPPGQATIINIAPSSSDLLGLPNSPLKWPRTMYARLVEKLCEFGAEVIVFDIHFFEKKNSEEDILFAKQVEKSGRVLLIEQIRRMTAPAGTGGRQDRLDVDALVPPYSPLAESALALAPFPIPKFPVRVNQCWIFKPSAGDIPTLPAVALQAAMLDEYDTLYGIIRTLRPDTAIFLPSTVEKLVSTRGRLVETMLNLRTMFQEESFMKAVTADLDEKKSLRSESIIALVDMYHNNNSRFINFYGPPGTVKTVSIQDLFAQDPNAIEPLRAVIEGKTIFIGAAGEQWSDQKDGFHTVFSRPDGLEISGVELAATVFGNLFEKSFIKPAPPAAALAIISTSSVVISLLSFYLPVFLSFASLLMLCACYLSFSFSLFSYSNTWLPLITPIIIQPPLAFLGAVLHKYMQARRDKRRIRKALELYIPDSVVQEIDDDIPETGDKLIYSTCLMTDAENYTALSEKLTPKDLSTLMKEYYQCIFSVVNRHQGVVCNMIGDSVLALWPSKEPVATLKEMGCRAALQIVSEVRNFNREHPGTRLPTRIGLHSGNLLIGNIGADGHFEYAPVGDIVNTNQRIEALNKQLGTKILASSETIDGIKGIFSRDLGTFLLGGKANPVSIHELISVDRISSDEHTLYFKLFPKAMDCFKRGQWSMAFDLFHECIDIQEHDGPSIFFLGLSHSFQRKPPKGEWKGVIRVSK